jgi:hypothetical protein
MILFCLTCGYDTTFFRLLSLGASFFMRVGCNESKIGSGSLLYFIYRDKILHTVFVA